MDWGISQEGCFDRVIIVQGASRLPGQEARLCRAECPPHFLFVLPKRKRAGHGTKEKTLRGDLTRRCQIIQNGGLAVTNCRPNPEVSYRLRYTYSARNCVPASESPPHSNVPNRTPPALLSAAAPPSNSGRGFQRGGTAVPPLCATRGYGGKRAKRRQRRMKRPAFEETARLAAH